MKIDDVLIHHYEIPAEKILTDSTHGEMRDFGLVSVRVQAVRV